MRNCTLVDMTGHNHSVLEVLVVMGIVPEVYCQLEGMSQEKEIRVILVLPLKVMTLENPLLICIKSQANTIATGMTPRRPSMINS